MKNVLFGIFAHPDDEAFGPSGSLYSAAHDKDSDVHLVLVTDGEQGTNCDDCDDLAEVRLKEWQESGRLIGTRSGIALHYPDGGLSNNLYLEIAEKILTHIKKTLKTYGDPVKLTMMTFDSDGITGHLDHIAVSFITTHVYLKLRESALPNIEIGPLKYYCLPSSAVSQPNSEWLYMPCGKDRDEIDEVFDYSEIKDQKLSIMKAHYSQREDMKRVLQTLDGSSSPASHSDHFRYFKN